jgi:hypothetical protein
MTRAVGWRHDDNFVNSIFQDWSDWDNLVSVRCILASLPGDLTLHSVGRPVAPKCDLDFAAKYAGGLHSWPPCRTGNVVDGDVDVTRSTEEAIDVAATWQDLRRKLRLHETARDEPRHALAHRRHLLR